MADEPQPVYVAQPLGRRQRKALAVRQALFDAGLAAFDRQPIGLVSVLDITEAADVAKGVFYLQFRSKDDYLLALWEEVKTRLLDAAGAAARDCKAQAERLEAVVCALYRFAQQAPAGARFWLRMSSFFPDEIGEPGHLARMRQTYVRELAAMIGDKAPDALSPMELAVGQTVDAMGWAAIGAALQLGAPLIEPRRLVDAIRATMA